jgi:hypothetical protein
VTHQVIQWFVTNPFIAVWFGFGIFAAMLCVWDIRRTNNKKKKGYRMGTININGVVYEGNNVSIVNGVVKIDGVIQTGEHLEKKIAEIRVIDGTIGALRTDASVYCQDVTGNIDAGGSVTVQGSVGGEIDAGGSIKCGDVTGNVDAGGSVTCGKISGRVDAGGSVRHG